jgi:hypothetical protein
MSPALRYIVFPSLFSYLILTFPRLLQEIVLLRVIKVQALEGRKAGEAGLAALNGSGSI